MATEDNVQTEAVRLTNRRAVLVNGEPEATPGTEAERVFAELGVAVGELGVAAGRYAELGLSPAWSSLTLVASPLEGSDGGVIELRLGVDLTGQKASA